MGEKIPSPVLTYAKLGEHVHDIHHLKIAMKKREIALSAQTLRKAHEAIFVKPLRGQITLLMRRVFNQLLINAQKQGAHIQTYRISISELTSDMKYDSHDDELIKEYLRRLNATQVEWDVTQNKKKRWGVSTMIADAEIEDGVLEYSFAPKIKPRLLDPAIYQVLNMQVLDRLKSNHAYCLYEACARYSTNPSGVTLELPWLSWYSMMAGVPEEDLAEAEYKYFSRDVLKPAVNQVNKLTDIEIEPIISKEGKRVSTIQFKVKRKAQADLNLDGPVLFNRKLRHEVEALGITGQRLIKVLADHDESVIKQALDDLKKRQARSNMPAIENPAAWFLSVLKNVGAKPPIDHMPENIELTKSVPKLQGLPTDKEAVEVKERGRVHASEAFYKVGLEHQQGVLEKFAETLTAAADIDSFRKNGLKSKRFQVLFFDWLSANMKAIP